MNHKETPFMLQWWMMELLQLSNLLPTLIEYVVLISQTTALNAPIPTQSSPKAIVNLAAGSLKFWCSFSLVPLQLSKFLSCCSFYWTLGWIHGVSTPPWIRVDFFFWMLIFEILPQEVPWVTIHGGVDGNPWGHEWGWIAHDPSSLGLFKAPLTG